MVLGDPMNYRLMGKEQLVDLLIKTRHILINCECAREAISDLCRIHNVTTLTSEHNQYEED